MDDAAKSFGLFWRLSLGALPAGLLMGIVWAASLRPQESDWFGMQYVYATAKWTLAGGVASIVFSILSFALREVDRRKSLAMAVPAAMIFACIGLWHLEQRMRAVRYRVEMNEEAVLAAQIRADPAIVIRERWHEAGTAKSSAMIRSLEDAQTPYTLEMLKGIYNDVPGMRSGMRSALFAHPNVDANFIRQHFAYALQRAEKTNHTMLANMVAHPNCPIEFVEQVAASNTLPVGAVFPARKALKERGGKVHPTY